MSREYKPVNELHDILKEHPYRMSMNTMFKDDYLNKLVDLAYSYSHIAWGDYKEEGNKELRKSTMFVHDYVACIGIWRRVGESMDYLFPYYEQMLSVIHRYIETGETPPVIYNLQKNKETGKYESVKYNLVTDKIYPGESKLLPAYFHYDDTIRFDVTVEEIYELYKKLYKSVTDEMLHEWAESYVNDKLHILKWLQENKK